MTIDEAIEQQKSIAKHNIYRSKESPNEAATFKALAENHEQLAEWLEELKAYRTLDKTNFSDGYNKAIDDFVKKISESNQGHWRVTKYEHCEAISETMSYDIGTIKLIAEQLKAGEEG